jgi:hypothetical protein
MAATSCFSENQLSSTLAQAARKKFFLPAVNFSVTGTTNPVENQCCGVLIPCGLRRFLVFANLLWKKIWKSRPTPLLLLLTKKVEGLEYPLALRF